MSYPSKDNNLEKSLLQEILNPSDYDTNFENFTQMITDLFGVDFCLIISDFNHLKYFYTVGKSNENNSVISPKKVSNLMQSFWMINLKYESKINSVSNLEHKKHQKLLPFFQEFNVKSLLGISTSFKGQINGIIILGKQEPLQWSQKDKTTLKRVSCIIGMACHLSQINTIINEKNINRDSPLFQSNTPKPIEENPILKLWWQSTKKQLDKQLEWNRKVIYNMITIMSDQTRNPLAIIKMVITVLRSKELSPEDLIKRLTMLEEAWSKLNNINEKILQLKHLKSQDSSCNLVSTNLKELIDNITHTCQSKWQEDAKNSLTLRIDFSLQPKQLIITDTQHFTNIIEELLTNAGKFSVPNSTVTLEVNQENNSNNSPIIITLSNLSEYGCQDNTTEFF
ncbi:GAF domain-containing protein [Cyanothece sp. BG0011]|uniref:GAF domain-containing sensor histidine kinase n=2 Tax=Cyanothece sp. BG0011 TaxID=2082950 RepID=UPI0018E5A899|nr:GAF domain-containing protein [Cyanothece sp. BG0011]